MAYNLQHLKCGTWKLLLLLFGQEYIHIYEFLGSHSQSQIQSSSPLNSHTGTLTLTLTLTLTPTHTLSVRKHCRTRRLKRCCLLLKAFLDFQTVSAFCVLFTKRLNSNCNDAQLLRPQQVASPSSIRLSPLSLSVLLSSTRTFVRLESVHMCVRKPAGAALKSNINFHLANRASLRESNS